MAKETDSKKVDDVITMLASMTENFGERFDKIDERFEKIDEHFEKIDERFDKIDDELTAVKSKVEGINARLDTEAVGRTDLKLPRRVHDLEEKVYGTGRSKHPKHVPL